jgi:hypothetical protein
MMPEEHCSVSQTVASPVMVMGAAESFYSSGRMKRSSGGVVRVQPNKRLKLTAPLFCGGHRFVNMKAARRSLGAFR